MNVQLKKGILELIVLVAVREKDMYGYELVAEVSKVVEKTDQRKIFRDIPERVDRGPAKEILSSDGFRHSVYGGASR